MEDAHVWFVRFAMDKQCRTLACGNRQGTVFVWDPQDMDRRPAVKLRREAPPASSRAHTTVSLQKAWARTFPLFMQASEGSAGGVHEPHVGHGPHHHRYYASNLCN